MNKILNFNEYREKRERELAEHEQNTEDWILSESDIAISYLSHETSNPRLACLYTFRELGGLLACNGHSVKDLILEIRKAARQAKAERKAMSGGGGQ